LLNIENFIKCKLSVCTTTVDCIHASVKISLDCHSTELQMNISVAYLWRQRNELI